MPGVRCTSDVALPDLLPPRKASSALWRPGARLCCHTVVLGWILHSKIKKAKQGNTKSEECED
eukprot:1150454-Pelagomonas_calceolata.AAC.1